MCIGRCCPYWHRHILERHFNSSARGQYGYQPRSKRYERWKRKHGTGQGKFLDLWLTGQSRRWLLSSANVSGTAGRVTVRMRAPWYFMNPKGKIVNARSKKFSSRSQPDKMKEVTTFNERDRQDIRKHSDVRLQFYLNQARAQTHITTHS